MKRVRYETQAIQSACSKVQKNEISWWARRKYKLFEWLGWQKKSRLGVSWVLELIPTELQSLFQGGLVSKPLGEGRVCFFFFLSNQTYFFWAGHLVIQIQKEWDWSPEMFTFWNTFQVPIQDDSWAQAFAFHLLFLPKPLLKLTEEGPSDLPTAVKRIEKLAKRSELVISCLKSGRGQKHAESKKPALGAMSLHLGSRMPRKPWVLTELQRSFQTGISQSG